VSLRARGSSIKDAPRGGYIMNYSSHLIRMFLKRLGQIIVVATFLFVAVQSRAEAALLLDTTPLGVYSVTNGVSGPLGDNSGLTTGWFTPLNGQFISYLGLYLVDDGSIGLYDGTISDCSIANGTFSAVATNNGWTYFFINRQLPADVSACVLSAPYSYNAGEAGHIYTLNSSFNTVAQSRWYDAGGIAPADVSTRIISPYTPAIGSTAASTTVGFSFPYYFNCTTSYGVYDSLIVDIKDLTNGDTISDVLPQAINICGQSTFYGTTTGLIAGHLYFWRPRMFSEATSTAILGDYYSLNVLYPSASSTPFVGATVGTSTLVDSTQLLSFLNVPNLLATRVPFAYIVQIRDLFYYAITSSSTATIPSGAVSIKFGSSATTTLDLFSTSTVTYFLTPSRVSLLRGLMVALIGLGWGVRKIQKHVTGRKF